MQYFQVIILTLISGVASAQSFSGKTNDILLNYKQPANVVTALPVITWTMPRIEYSNNTEGLITIEASIKSTNLLKSVVLEIESSNGTTRKQFPAASQSLNYQLKQNVMLADGENTLHIIAENALGGSVVSSRYVLVGKDAITDAVDVNRNDYALVIATNKYDDWNDLANPIDDARTIESILVEKYGFKVEFLEDPTYEEIYAKISDYNTKKFKPQDQLFVFFAGHGVFDETLKEGFVVARDSKLEDKGRTTYIPHFILRQRLDNIQCEHIFLVMDVCFGGTLDPLVAKGRAIDPYAETPDRELIARKLSKHTRKFLTSGSKEYVSDGIAGKHSPFAAQFIKALKESGGKGNRFFSLYDLVGYFERLTSIPRFGKFSEADDPTSDFVFVAKQ